MTPKEKAAELVNKERTIIRIAHIYNSLPSEDEIYLAKQCAIIAVDEILNAHLFDLEEKKYWQQVKQEIENL
jgi:hypothetical protein